MLCKHWLISLESYFFLTHFSLANIFKILNLGAALYLLENSLKFTMIGLHVFTYKDMLTMTQLSTDAPFTRSNLPSQTAPSKLQPQQS